jgi:hypothetical protein
MNSKVVADQPKQSVQKDKPRIKVIKIKQKIKEE